MHHNSGYIPARGTKPTRTQPEGKHYSSEAPKRNEKRKEWQRDDKRARYA